VARARDLAHRGDAAGLSVLLAEPPDLLLVEPLLAHRADATRIGVGRWVLHPQLAPLLAGYGAAIDSSGSWIGASCTGNQGRRDDPEYVRALLRHGASVNDRRTFDHGADPEARDSHGRTPLDWLEQAAPSVSRAAVRNLIAPTTLRPLAG